MKKQESLTKQSLFLVIGRSVAHLLQLFLPIILVRIFTKEEYGLYRQLFLIYYTFISIGQMGMDQSLFYFFPRHPEKRESLLVQTFLFSAVSLAAGTLRRPASHVYQYTR